MEFLYFFLVLSTVYCSGVYDDSPKVTFTADINTSGSYFGFSVLLSKNKVFIGAPLAYNRELKINRTGLVYSCPMKSSMLQSPSKQTCANYKVLGFDKYTEGMWFGSNLNLSPQNVLYICAPRWSEYYGKRDILSYGLCIAKGANDRVRNFIPLKQKSNLVFHLDGKRPSYGHSGEGVHYYGFGQAGFSAKLFENELLFGAPGLLHWAGGVVNYEILSETKSYYSQQPIPNPYYTKELDSCGYFGYSVDAAKFANRTLFIAGAPREKQVYGQVFVYEKSSLESAPIKIQQSLTGPHMGSYFGATLCTLDVNNDGRTDVIVGAPNYVKENNDLPYDQGAVFVYINEEKSGGKFHLEEAGVLLGSKQSGARFGTAISDLGDITGDGYREIAVGAPWEDGKGAVYIYKGTSSGFEDKYLQRITASGAVGFGISISKGVDVDWNNCNEMLVGAYESGTAYLYKCLQKIQVSTSIKVDEVVDLTLNATEFLVSFCIHAASNSLWPDATVRFNAVTKIDLELNRAWFPEPEFIETIKAGENTCRERQVKVNPQADFSTPLFITYNIKPAEDHRPSIYTGFRYILQSVGVTDNSVLSSTFRFQLTTDCGDDLICTPNLKSYLEHLDESPYVPGNGGKLGAKVTVKNLGEPAYNQKVYLDTLLQPERIPNICSYNKKIICALPSPLHRGNNITFDIEFQYNLNTTDETEWRVVAKLEDDSFGYNKTEEVQELRLKVKPVARFEVFGSALPNKTLPVSRQKLNDDQNLTVLHYYEIMNYGPSDWIGLDAEITLPEKVKLTHPVNNCLEENGTLHCTFSVPAKESLHVVLDLLFELQEHGDYLDQHSQLNVTSVMQLYKDNKTLSITTTLVLDPAPPIWPIIVGIVSGLLILGLINFGFYKCGFFTRGYRDQLELQHHEESPQPMECCSSTASEANLLDD